MGNLQREELYDAWNKARTDFYQAWNHFENAEAPYVDAAIALVLAAEIKMDNILREIKALEDDQYAFTTRAII